MTDRVLTRTHGLEGGLRVHLRLARLGDEPAAHALLAACGVDAGPLDVRRLVAYDPASRAVLAALAPLDGAETLVGLGAIDLEADAEVDALVVDERVGRGLAELLVDVLRARAHAHARRVA